MANESFIMVELFDAPSTSEPGMAVLDTMVVSALESITRGGFQPTKREHRQVAHLIRWLQHRSDYQVFALYGALEGAGFHKGGISYHMVMRRHLAAVACIEYGRQHLDQLTVANGQVPRAIITDMSVDFQSTLQLTLDLAELLLPLTTLSCYVAALAVAKADSLHLSRIRQIEYVFDVLVDRLNYISIYAFYAAILLFAGTPGVRNRLRTGFFKLRAEDVRKSCMSAAWDLGYLQILSSAQSPGMADLFDHRRPVVVTAERRLPEVASWLRGATDPDTGLRVFDSVHLDPVTRLQVLLLMEALQYRRSIGMPTAPDWQRCIRAAESLEEDLGFTNVPPLLLEPDPLAVKAEPPDWICFADSLTLTGMAVVDHFRNIKKGDPILGGLAAIAGLIADNANARQRTEADTWRALLPSLRFRDSDDFPLGVILAWACTNTDSHTFTAIAQLIVATNNYGPALIQLWHIARTILDDTAEARGIPRDQLVAGIQSRLRSSGSSVSVDN
jgi:hypothetical protein